MTPTDKQRRYATLVRMAAADSLRDGWTATVPNVARWAEALHLADVLSWADGPFATFAREIRFEAEAQAQEAADVAAIRAASETAPRIPVRQAGTLPDPYDR